MVGPIVDEIGEEYKDKAIVAKLDVDNNPGTTVRFGIRNIPTVLFFKNGQWLINRLELCLKVILWQSWKLCFKIMISSVSVFCASSQKVDQVYFHDALELGEILAHNQISVLYGGGAIGLMGCLADTILKNGGKITE